jgi:hypothetical protein
MDDLKAKYVSFLFDAQTVERLAGHIFLKQVLTDSQKIFSVTYLGPQKTNY